MAAIRGAVPQRATDLKKADVCKRARTSVQARTHLKATAAHRGALPCRRIPSKSPGSAAPSLWAPRADNWTHLHPTLRPSAGRGKTTEAMSPPLHAHWMEEWGSRQGTNR
eukprot:UN2205